MDGYSSGEVIYLYPNSRDVLLKTLSKDEAGFAGADAADVLPKEALIAPPRAFKVKDGYIIEEVTVLKPLRSSQSVIRSQMERMK